MSPQSAPIPAAAPASVSHKPRYIIWIAAVAMVGLSAAVYVRQSRIPPIRAVVVRPLANPDGPPWLAGAITEEIVDALRPVTQAAADPAFSAVLEGDVARSGDRVRVTARLSRPDGHHYWTRTFERPITAIGVEVAGAVVPLARRKASRYKPSIQAD